MLIKIRGEQKPTHVNYKMMDLIFAWENRLFFPGDGIRVYFRNVIYALGLILV